MNERQVGKSASRHVETKPMAPPAAEAAIVFSFEQLEVYRAARAFKKRVYALAKLLPDDERYRLRLQMRKAGLSLTNAIAERHGRHTYKNKRHYCHEARGSLQELVDDVSDCIDNDYAKIEHLHDLRRDAFRMLQLIDGWARWLAAQNAKLSNAARAGTTRPPQPTQRHDDLTT